MPKIKKNIFEVFKESDFFSISIICGAVPAKLQA